MEKATFLRYKKPLLTGMVQADNPKQLRELITLSRAQGAEAFGMQFCKMKAAYRNREVYRAIFDFASPQPVYVTNYRPAENAGKSDEVLAAELLELAECGATLCDVMGDYFDHCEGELTMNEDAIAKQRALIDALHERGAEVVMSSHVHKFIPAERVLEIALEHQRRGADICKIVTGATNMQEQLENMRIMQLLKEKLDIPFLFLCGGECKILRRIGGQLGNCMSLCVCRYDALATPVQPLITDVKALRDLL